MVHIMHFKGVLSPKRLIISHLPIPFLAQNGFARLMGLEDTSPLTTENEGLDSGLGEAPPTSDKKMHSSTDNLKPLETEMSDIVEKATSTRKTRENMRVSELEESSLHPLLIPDETEHPPLRKSSRKKRKKDLEPDKILDQKQKKSLEKVAEWLMKVPTEGSLEVEKPDDDADDSDSCSSDSTIDVRQHNSDVYPKRENRAKALEEQVFGAVYKRERRMNRSISPGNVFVKPLKTKARTTPDFSMKTSSDDKSDSDIEEEQQMTEEVKDTSSDILKEAEQMEAMEENDVDKYEEDLTNFAENDKNNDKEEVPCPASDSGQLERNSMKRTRNTQQQVDSDLLEQTKAQSESTEQKKVDKRKGKNTRPEKCKPARVTKPLVLVEVQNGDTSPKTIPRSEEVQVHIENYPSSEDQDKHVTRITRRSRRLQVFTEEIQEDHKRANLKTPKVPKKVSKVTEQSKGTKDGTVVSTASPTDKNMTKVPERNGCIYDQDLGGIENMESGERTSYMGPQDNAKESIAEVPNPDTLSKASPACHVTVVPSSISPTEAAAVDPTLESDSPNNIQLDTSACKTECAGIENEEDKNDSELDTEQLLRSFKATKRKSFHLGGPNVKRSRSSDQENFQCTELGKSQMHTKMSEISNKEPLRDHENLSGSDFISPSMSPRLRTNTVVEKTDQVVVEASIPESRCSGQDNTGGNGVPRNSISSPLTPNKVSKREIESPHLSGVPQVVDSGLHFMAVEQEELNEPKQLYCPMSEKRESITVANASLKRSVTNTEQILNTESSLTPDGLGIPVIQIVDEAKSSSNGSGELSAQSSIKPMPRKRTRAQRLESSSDSSACSGEDLPTLTEIFGTSAPPTATAQDQGKSDKANRCKGLGAGGRAQLSRPPACPSPDFVNSSQASVDLFGTPEECKLISQLPKLTTNNYFDY